MSHQPHILIIEDTESLAVTYQMYLAPLNANISWCETGKEGMAAISATPPDLVLLDLNLPDIQGQEVLSWITQKYTCPVVIVTAHGSLDIAMDLIRAGAKDFLEKPVTADRLRTTAINCLENYQLKTTLTAIQKTLTRDHYHGFIGACIAIQAVYKTIDAAAPSNATVFITGESGTGKEVCAEAIKQQSPRCNKPFIAINCGAIPRELIESELFGHVKGAFTGAHTERKGAIVEADGGTLFLDEIGEMPLDLQTKLLRFLQNSTIQKVGSSKAEKVDVRIICATNRDPYAEVQNGNFREDLYYRLNVLPITLPPLRERGDDITLIALHFLKKYTREENKTFEGISGNVKQVFLNYPWPGNIRQLQNVIRNIVVLHNDSIVKTEHLPAPLNQLQWQTTPKNTVFVAPPSPNLPTIAAPAAPVGPHATKAYLHNTDQPAVNTSTPPAPDEPRVYHPAVSSDMGIPTLTLAQIERAAIEQAIEYTQGNIPKAAALLDVSPSTIYRKKQQWDVAPP